MGSRSRFPLFSHSLWFVSNIIPTFYKLSLHFKMISPKYVSGDIHLVPVLEVWIDYSNIIYNLHKIGDINSVTYFCLKPIHIILL